MKRGASLLCKEVVSSSDDLAGWSTVKPGPTRGGPALHTAGDPVSHRLGQLRIEARLPAPGSQMRSFLQLCIIRIECESQMYPC